MQVQETNLPQKARYEEAERLHKASWLISLLLKLAAAMNVEVSKATQAVYLEQLAMYSEPAVTAGIDRTIRSWDKPHMLPPVAYVLARIEDHFDAIRRKQLERRTQQLLSRPSLHPDFHSDDERRRE